MKRALCLWLPNWPIQRLVITRPELKGRAILLHFRVGSQGERVTACSLKAQAHGVRVGMPLAEAASLCKKFPRREGSQQDHSAFHRETHDMEADCREFVRLAEWCEPFSPRVGLESRHDDEARRSLFNLRKGPESLLLDVTGVGVWFGGEACLAENVVRQFQRRGYFVQVAIADTVGAAWAVAHFDLGIRDRGWEIECTRNTSPHTSNTPSRSEPQIPHSSRAIIPPDQTLAALRPLPVEALRLPDETVELLHQLGIFKIQELLRLPRASLSSRLGPEVLQRVDQATGAAEELLVAHRPPPKFEAQCSLEYPTERNDAIDRVLTRLVQQITQQLAQQDRGVLRLEIRLDCAADSNASWDTSLAATKRDKGNTVRFRLDLFFPVTQPCHLMDLVRMQLEQTTLPGPLRRAGMQAVMTAPRERPQHELLEDTARMGARDLARLVDRLSSRFGRDRILRPRLQAEAQPERACRFIPLTGRAASRRHGRSPQVAVPPRGAAGSHDRPLQLCHPPLLLNAIAGAADGPPKRFYYRHCLHHVERFWGPERIETAWWRGRIIRRDYYRIETRAGNRFWLFRQLDDETWYLHGIFE